MKLFGVSRYLKLSEHAVLATVRLNLYIRLLCAGDQYALKLEHGFDDRFGELPDEVSTWIRVADFALQLRHRCLQDRCWASWLGDEFCVKAHR